MENINEFMEQAKIEILSYLPEDVKKELTIEDARVVKMNDQVLYGLTMKRSAEESAPAIYMNDLYRRFNEGEPFSMLMSEAALEYLNAVSVAPPEITTIDLTFDKIKDDLTLKLVEIRRNHEYLSEVPYVKAGNGFAIVCDIKIEDGDSGQYRTTVTRNLMNEMNYDMQELFSTAIESAQLKDPAVMNSVRSQLLYSDEPNLLRGQDPIREEEKDNMYVITNPDCLYEAIALYYPGIQEKIAEKLGENYYVIPSSVNEVLAVPESKAPELQEIAAMVYEANENLLDPKDVLSNNIFYFDKDTKRLETIHSEMFRGINSQEQELRS